MSAMSSVDHLSASQRRLARAVIEHAEASIKMMKPNGDAVALKDLCEAVNKLNQTLNKLPAFKDGVS